MTNSCETCPRNCCINFKLTQELFDPKTTAESLKSYPYVKKTGSMVVLAPGGHEATVGVYNCTRFDPKTASCLDYDSQPRPPFCKNTGNKFYPHQNCLLKQ